MYRVLLERGAQKDLARLSSEIHDRFASTTTESSTRLPMAFKRYVSTGCAIVERVTLEGTLTATTTFTPILASDTTGAILLPLAVLFWGGTSGGALAGLLALVLYRCKRVQQVWGLLLGTFSMVAGAGGLFVLILFTNGREFWIWVAVLVPLKPVMNIG